MNMEDDIPIPNHIHGMPADFVQRARNVLAGGHNTANLEEGERLVAQLAQQYAQPGAIGGQHLYPRTAPTPAVGWAGGGPASAPCSCSAGEKSLRGSRSESGSDGWDNG